jgi:hypothetical protein
MTGQHQTFLRAWTLLAIFMLLSSMLAWSAIAAKPVFANAGPATQLGFDPGPSATYLADDTISVTVEIQDASGDIVDEGTEAVGDIALSLNASNGAVIEATDAVSISTADGSADFLIHVRKAGTYTLTAKSGTLTDGISSAFQVTPGALATTVLTPNPETKTADIGQATYTATGKDAWGNDKGDVTEDVTFALDLDEEKCSANVCGTHTTGSYQISDSTESGTAVLNITPGELHHFVVETSPTSPATDYVAGASFDVTVTAYDGWGNIKTDYNETATVSGLAPSPGCADCNPVAPTPAEYGSTTVTFSAGVAVTTATGFLAGSGQAITATGDKTATSDEFTILPAALHHFTWDSIGSQQTAGASFDIKATAFDQYGNVKTDYDGGLAVLTSTLLSSPSGDDPSVGDNLDWSAGVGTASVFAVKATAFGSPDYAATESFTITDDSVSRQSGAFGVKPNSLNDLSFAATNEADPTFGGGQPLDTKVSSIIHSTCDRAPTGSADPCLSTSAPVKVLARDAFGNNKPGVGVTITADPAVSPASAFVGTKTGTTADGTGTTPLGEVWFGSLKITAISGTKTDKYKLVATSGTVTKDSQTFRIVSDLANCFDQPKCFNNTKNNSVDKPENSYSQAKTASGTFGNVFTTTNFSDPVSDVDNRCSSVRTRSTIGSAIDVRVVGAAADIKNATTTMVMVLPMKTLKFYNLTARSADSYNVCLGAINLNGSTSNSDAWIGKDKKNKALAASQGLDADSLNRFWGVPADCGQKYLRPTDPCISLKTKSAKDVAARMTQVTGETWTIARVNSELNYVNADVAIFITKPFPWDGKGGLY